MKEVIMSARETKASATSRHSRVSRAVSSSLEDAPTGKLTLQRGEPADCFLTGASRSLQRRLMGLNIPGLSTLTEKKAAAKSKPLQSHPRHA